MYESLKALKIKEKYGDKSAAAELKRRESERHELPLHGINNEAMYIVLNEDIIKLLETISKLYASVTDTAKVSEVILLDSYHSATIEGARTTVDNVRRSYEHPDTKDDKMVVNTMLAMNYAYEHVISQADMRELWEIIVKDVCENTQYAGKVYRDGMVYIGNALKVIHTPAEPKQIGGMIDSLYDFLSASVLNVWLKAAVMHFYFVYVHPYCDGNGRMVRVLTQSYLYHNGLDKMRYIALARAINEELSGYYTALSDSEYVYANGKSKMDITPFVYYFLSIVERALVTSLQEDVEINAKQQLLLGKMHKQGQNAEITIATAARILNLSQQTAAKHLNSLVESGHLIKLKRDRRNIYILK